MRRIRFAAVLAALLTTLLGGCAETQLAAQAVKGIPSSGKGQGIYKVGDPYQIGGVWYYPKADYGFDETGIASWYGEDFHGKLTANGELFDLNRVSAAHRTLPMPSLVRITNLENGRSLVVRVNDRGPFARGRIVDVSRRTAQLLGFERPGTAKVRVQILADESRQIAEAMTKGQSEPQLVASAGNPIADPVQSRPDLPVAAPRSAVAVQSLPLPGVAVPVAPPQLPAAPRGVLTGPAPAAPGPSASAQPTLPGASETAVTMVPVTPTQIFVQAGAFQNVANAVRLSAQLATVGRSIVAPATVRGQQFYRVRFGPFDTSDEADRTLDRVIGAGFPDARVVVE